MELVDTTNIDFGIQLKLRQRMPIMIFIEIISQSTTSSSSSSAVTRLLQKNNSNGGIGGTDVEGRRRRRSTRSIGGSRYNATGWRTATGKVRQQPRDKEKEEGYRQRISSSSRNSSINSRRRVDACNKQHTPSSIITSVTKTTGTETIEGTTIIIFDRVKEQHEWR